MSEERNPKYIEALKRGKIDYSVVPWAAITGLALAMQEGAGKYGRFNYRQDKIEARTYIGAILRHLFGDPSTGSVGWVNGEDIDEESGLHHLDKVMACCLLVRDAMEHGMLIDNRLETESKTPPSQRDDVVDGLSFVQGLLDGVTENGDALDIKYGEPEDDGFVTLHPKPDQPDESWLDQLIRDLGKIDTQMSAREIHMKIAEPGIYVEFTDVSPGVNECFTSIVGPFGSASEAKLYAQENPDNIAGLKTIFEVK